MYIFGLRCSTLVFLHDSVCGSRCALSAVFRRPAGVFDHEERRVGHGWSDLVITSSRRRLDATPDPLRCPTSPSPPRPSRRSGRSPARAARVTARRSPSARSAPRPPRDPPRSRPPSPTSLPSPVRVANARPDPARPSPSRSRRTVHVRSSARRPERRPRRPRAARLARVAAFPAPIRRRFDPSREKRTTPLRPSAFRPTPPIVPRPSRLHTRSPAPDQPPPPLSDTPPATSFRASPLPRRR